MEHPQAYARRVLVNLALDGERRDHAAVAHGTSAPPGGWWVLRSGPSDDLFAFCARRLLGRSLGERDLGRWDGRPLDRHSGRRGPGPSVNAGG
jgi:hypothetical protein